MTLSAKSLIHTLVFLVGFLAFTQVTFFPSYLYYLVVFSLLICLLTFFLKEQFCVNKSIFLYFVFFCSCFLVGIVSYPVNSIISNKFDYSELVVIGRNINLSLFVIMFVMIYSYSDRLSSGSGSGKTEYFRVIKAYQFGLFLVMVLGVWQLLSFYTLIEFPFQTRAHLHSTYGYDYSIVKRLTSVAREPSYFVMLAIDFIGLSMLFNTGRKRFFLVAFGFVLLVFSVSPSGYIVFFGSLLTAWLLSALKYFKGTFKPERFYFALASLFFVMAVFLLNRELLDYVYRRIFDAAPSNSSRFYMVVMPYIWSLDSDVFSFLFGHGIKSYSILGQHYQLPNGTPVHVTSNNIFTDVFWESGFLGFVLLFLFFCFLLLRVFNARVGRFYSFIAFYFSFDLILSGFFRADYASFRFFLILYLIYVIVKVPVDFGYSLENRRINT